MICALHTILNRNCVWYGVTIVAFGQKWGVCEKAGGQVAKAFIFQLKFDYKGTWSDIQVNCVVIEMIDGQNW